jgi:hypothetical protein
MDMNSKKEKGKGELWDTRANPFAGNGAQHIAPSFTECTDLARLLDGVCRAGCAIMVGHTRDGGAVVFTILDGDNRHRTYCSNDPELQGAIDSALAAYSEDA